MSDEQGFKIGGFSMTSKVNFSDFSGTVVGVIPETKPPKLDPMPGRVICRMNERMDKFPGSETLMDSRYIYNPYIGEIVEIGEALNAEQEKIRNVLVQRKEAGQRCIFTPGAGVEYGTAQMYDLKIRTPMHPEGHQPFLWMANLRVFRIEDFATMLDGGDALGGSE